MSLNQLAALTGKRIRPGYVAQINAQAPLLTQLNAQKATQNYLDKQNEIAAAGLNLAERQASEAEKQRKRAQRLGYLNAGLNTALGIGNLASTYDWGNNAPSAAADSVLSVPDATDILQGMGASQTPISPLSSPTSGFDWSSLTDVPSKIGSGIVDFGKGLYDTTIGNIIDLF